MLRIKLIPVDQSNAWREALERCGRYDIYHCPEYHRVSEIMGEGVPYLFTYQDHNLCAALPLLIRPISQINGLEAYEAMDATSVYGYCGAVSNVNQKDKGAIHFRSGFQSALHETLKHKNIVALFSRLHPLIDTGWLLGGLGEVSTLGPTVALDLTQSLVDQEKSMNQRVRRDLRKAINSGVIVKEDSHFEHIDEFISIYNETMQARDAQDYYFFPKKYYIHLKENLGDRVKLYFAEHNKTMICAAIFFATEGIIQYHLSGTPAEHRKHSGLKLIFDEVRRWGTQNGYSWFHLGGGVGAAKDSLLDFKAGFSKILFNFDIVKIVLDPRLYFELNRVRKNHENRIEGHTRVENFFPVYRSPLTVHQDTCSF